MSSKQNQQSVPLSLRRKLVIALDPELLTVPATADNTLEAVNEAANEAVINRFLSFKTVAWVKANLIRPDMDHVFLVTSLEPAGSSSSSGIDSTTISAMWTSLFSDQDPHVDQFKVAEAALRRLAHALSLVGVSASMEVLKGGMEDTVPEYVHRHRGEILVLQAPERSTLLSSLAYSWAELCSQKAECPAVIVKRSDLPDNIT
ncbi:hypothetical protein LPJ66_011845, partial [Kickxella alabastrina]